MALYIKFGQGLIVVVVHLAAEAELEPVALNRPKHSRMTPKKHNYKCEIKQHEASPIAFK